jgi:hypothetical protein
MFVPTASPGRRPRQDALAAVLVQSDTNPSRLVALRSLLATDFASVNRLVLRRERLRLRPLRCQLLTIPS